MKKISSIIYLVLLVSSCTTFQEKSIVPHNEILNAVISDETTKTYLDQQRQNRWVADDRISAYVGNTYNQQYAFQGSTGDNAGDFSKVQGGGLSTGEDLNAIYAIYPYASSNSISENGVITVELPHIQKYAADSFGQGANTMVAVTAGVDDSFLKFKNICGYLIIKVYGDALITSITLSGNNGEKISGKAKITPSYSGLPSVAMDNAANSSITLECGSGVSLGSGSASATSFWFALPPTNFSNGISITVKSADGKIMTKSTDKSISVARNTYYTLSPFKYEGEIDETPTLVYENAVASLYNKLYDRFKGGDDNYNYMSEFTANVLFLPGRQGDWVDGGKHQNAFLHRWDPSTDYIKNLWTNSYSDIALCNSSIEKLEEIAGLGTLEPEVIESYKAEVRAIRAFYYMWLTDFFGRIPIVTSSELGVGDVQQSERSAAYKFVKDEICAIIPHLAEGTAQKTSSEYYARFTKAAGYAMLAKLAINGAVFSQDKWNDGKFTGGIAKVEPTVTAAGKADRYTVDGKTMNAWETVVYCQQRVAELGYGLEANFAANFTNSGNENSNENIFVRPMDDNVYRKFDTQVTRSLHWNHASTIGFSSWNGTAATVHALKAFGYEENINLSDLSKSTFKCDDPRFGMSFFYGSCSVNGVKVSAGVSEDKWPEGYYIGYAAMNDYSIEDFSDPWGLYIVRWGGVRIKKYEFDPTTSDQNAFNADRTIFRYADILLLAAEAEYRMGVMGNAADLINKVRERVGVEPIGEDDVNLEFILNERIRELIWETPGTRGDMVRCGIYTEADEDKFRGVKHATSASDWVYDATGYTCVFPIPDNVLQLNSHLTQNPGY